MKHFVIALFFAGTLKSQDTIKVQKDAAYQTVEVMPVPEEGIAGFYKYISQNIHYPDSARNNGISGKVFTKFVIERDGSMSNVQVLKGVPACPECDAEAVRVLESYPGKWIPGKQNGRTVRTYFNLPLTFKIQ